MTHSATQICSILLVSALFISHLGCKEPGEAANGKTSGTNPSNSAPVNSSVGTSSTPVQIRKVTKQMVFDAVKPLASKFFDTNFPLGDRVRGNPKEGLAVKCMGPDMNDVQLISVSMPFSKIDMRNAQIQFDEALWPKFLELLKTVTRTIDAEDDNLEILVMDLLRDSGKVQSALIARGDIQGVKNERHYASISRAFDGPKELNIEVFRVFINPFIIAKEAQKKSN